MSPIAPTYGPKKMNLVKGQGSWLYDEAGKSYLDFASGIAVTSLGHGHPALTAALQAQAGELLHVSNLYGIPAQQRLAEMLTASSFASSIFFCNSGAEAMEACFKFARRFHWHAGAPERTEILSFSGAFHGRTLATIAAGGAAKYMEGFGPKSPNFHQVPFGDLNAARDAIGPNTAAIVVEPIQGEGGIRPNTPEFMQAVRKLATAHGLLLILDEVQTGVGRTGTFWAHEQFGIEPDLLASAKGLGGGVPVGAVLMREEVADALAPGTHGTTFGGNPLAMAAAKTVVDLINRSDFLEDVRRKGSHLARGLDAIVLGDNRVVAGHRGMGLMRGIQLHEGQSVPDLVEAARCEGLLTVPAGDQTVRLLPPLTVSIDEIDQACAHLRAAIRQI